MENMEKQFDIVINSIQAFSELKEKVFSSSPQEKIFVSPFAGSSKSLFIKTIIEKEKQILLLCPTVQSVNETNVELSILELEDLIV